MPANLDALLAQARFGLSVHVPAAGSVALDWVHSSDLEDPSPFLGRGQMLLTTGRQFHDDEDDGFASGYVARLQAAGVVALGFGTEVIRAGTPSALIRASRQAGMPLVEVPYRTPFIAISQWVAATQAADARRRVDQVLEDQNAVSIAALTRDGMVAAIQRAAERLGCDIALFDADADVAATGGRSGRVMAEVRVETARLLGLRRRSRSEFASTGGFASVQTLGRVGRLTGALAFVRADPFNSGDLSVATTLVALAEVSLEHRLDLRTSLRSLMAQLFALLKDGRVAEVRRAIESIPAGLPGSRFQVVAVALDPGDPGLRDTLERRASVAANRLFVVNGDQRLTLLVDPDGWSSIRTAIEARAKRAGVSEIIGWDRLDIGLVQADRALQRAEPGSLVRFDDLVSSSFLGLLTSASVAEVAESRLSALLTEPDGRSLLGDASVWLAHNCQWDPAARSLGIHRHSLKAKMVRLGSRTGLDLDRFQDRAELWAMLSALDLAGR
jgi:purine catabolism regulator